MAHKQGLLSGLVFHCSGGEGEYQDVHSQLASFDLSARCSTDSVKQVLTAYKVFEYSIGSLDFPPHPPRFIPWSGGARAYR